MELLLKYWPITAATICVLANLIVLLAQRTYAKREDMIALENKVGQLESRIDKMPEDDQIHELNLEIEKLRGDLKEIKPELKQVSRLSDLLLENELKGATSANASQ